ncbi:MAG: putative cytokinetic ring protein SteA [Corynebacterium sp.]|nr:putative cytokinetic ring protein SteA [Corynebacterium sp.]
MTGPARKLPGNLRAVSPGDIAVITAAAGGISQSLAERLIARNVAAVVVAEDISAAAIPHYGPQLLINASIPVIVGVGGEVTDAIRDGKKLRLEGGEVYVGSNQIGNGTLLDEELADTAFTAAQDKLTTRLNAYFGNAIEYLNTESPLFIDGIGIPDTDVDMDNRHVIVIAPAPDVADQLRSIRTFLRDVDPVIIGVDTAADTALKAGVKPDLIVGNPDNISNEALRSGARVVVPADPDGVAAGIERIQDLGVGAVTFPARSHAATELAILLADFHAAATIVVVGEMTSLDAIFAGRAEAGPSAMLTSLKAADRLISARTVAALSRPGDGSGLAWLWAFVGLVVLLGVVAVIAGFSGEGSFTDNLVQTWSNTVALGKGWVS